MKMRTFVSEEPRFHLLNHVLSPKAMHVPRVKANYLNSAKIKNYDQPLKNCESNVREAHDRMTIFDQNIDHFLFNVQKYEM